MTPSRVEPAAWVAIGAADRVHDRGPAAHRDVPFRGGAHEGAVTGVDDERPVRALFPLQQPAEEHQRVAERVVADLGQEGPLDDEVGALPGADLVRDDAAYGFGVPLVVDVEAVGRHGGRCVRKPEKQFGHRDPVLLGDGQRDEGRAVVGSGEAAFGDLPVRRHDQDIVPGPRAAGRRVIGEGDVGQGLRQRHVADQDVDRVRDAGLRTVQEGEGGCLEVQYAAEQVAGVRKPGSCRVLI